MRRLRPALRTPRYISSPAGRERIAAGSPGALPIPSGGAPLSPQVANQKREEI